MKMAVIDEHLEVHSGEQSLRNADLIPLLPDFKQEGQGERWKYFEGTIKSWAVSELNGS